MAEPLTEKDLAIIGDYLNKDHGGCLPDWPLMQTAMGKVDGPIFQRLLASIDRLQERVEEAERQLRVAKTEAVECMNQTRSHSERMGILRTERDEARALAERRKSALVKIEAVANQERREFKSVTALRIAEYARAGMEEPR